MRTKRLITKHLYNYLNSFHLVKFLPDFAIHVLCTFKSFNSSSLDHLLAKKKTFYNSEEHQISKAGSFNKHVWPKTTWFQILILRAILRGSFCFHAQLVGDNFSNTILADLTGNA